ncbi:signal recognition particle-docking protein FtsY [Candidatus Bipolaricaulota bacterium]|nr:signal recognition particle-docking protein FtsY [Candidatus Bipolaricaulota bacterium]
MAWIDRLKVGLSKTRTGFTGSISQVLRGAKKLSADDVERLEEALIAGDVGAHTAMALVKELQAALSRKDNDPVHVLRMVIEERLAGIERPLCIRSDNQPTVITMTGVNGAGKTTTIAKLATQIRAAHPGIPMTFAAADTFRAAAIEQLGIWADRIGVDFIRHQSGADPSAVVYDAVDHAMRTGGVLFVDTAGRLQTKHNLMEELKKIERTVAKKLGRGSDERLLVLDATTGQNGISQAHHFHDAIDLTGIVLTKVDGTGKGGVVLAIWDALHIPLTHIGVGETAEDLHAFSAAEFAEALFDSE